MEQAKAIVIASAILGVCLLTQTGYTILHDHSVAEEQHQDRERAANLEKETLTKAKTKGAWERATKDLDSELGAWINEQDKAKKGGYVFIRWAWVKAFANSDITWNDPKTVTAKGIIVAAPETGETKYYSWSRGLVWLDDDSWGAKRATFAQAILPKAQEDEMFTVNIKHP